MATKKIIIKIDENTHYDKYSAKLKFGKVLTSTLCGLCGIVISAGESSWETQTGSDDGWMSYHENCITIISVENAIGCVGHLLQTLGQI